MGKIIIYVDTADHKEGSVTCSGNFVITGRSSDLLGQTGKINMLLELLLEQMGSNPEIEFRVRE